MVTLTLNSISAVSIDGLESAKNSLLNINYYSRNQDEIGSVSNLRSEGLTYGSYNASFSRPEPEWKIVNKVYNPSPFNTVFINEIEEKQKTNEEKGIKLRNEIIKLQEDLGNDIFDKLSYDHILLLINTAGVIKAGPINIKEIYDFIEG